MNKASFFLLIILGLGVIIRGIILINNQKPFADGDKISFVARILDAPSQKWGRQQFTLAPPGYDKVTISTSIYPEYAYGEKIKVEGKIKLSELEDGRVLSNLYFPQIIKVDDGNLLFGTVKYIRSQVKEAFSHFLPPASASLLLGIVFGIKEGMPEDFDQALRTSGVYHVIAASGMNVTMLAGFLIAFLSHFLRRQTALIYSILGIVFYTFLAGLELSIVRASLMAIIAFTALLLGRQSTALFSLILTALFMLLFEPRLILDIGFQLSFAATLGILLIKPLLPGVNKKEANPTLALLSEDLGSTTSAQIATVPIMLFYFHQYGLLSILINALVLWMVPILMVIGSISAFLSLFFVSVGSVVAVLALPFLFLFEAIIMLSQGLNPVFGVEDLPIIFVILYYFALFGFIYYLRFKKTK